MRNRGWTAPAVPKISSSPRKSRRSSSRQPKTLNIILLTLLVFVPRSIKNFHQNCQNRLGNQLVASKSHLTSCLPSARPMRWPSNGLGKTLRIKISSSSSWPPPIRLLLIHLSSLAQTASIIRRGAYSLKTTGARWGCRLNLSRTNRMAVLTEELMNRKLLGSLQLKIMRTLIRWVREETPHRSVTRNWRYSQMERSILKNWGSLLLVSKWTSLKI